MCSVSRIILLQVWLGGKIFSLIRELVTSARVHRDRAPKASDAICASRVDPNLSGPKAKELAQPAMVFANPASWRTIPTGVESAHWRVMNRQVKIAEVAMRLARSHFATAFCYFRIAVAMQVPRQSPSAYSK
jgi:hypothetical protein